MIVNETANKILRLLATDTLHTSEISRRIKIPRTTVEYTLRTLEKSGHANSLKDGRKTVWKISVPKETGDSVQIIRGIKNIIKSFEDSVNRRGLEVVVIESDESARIFERKRYNDLFKTLNHRLGETGALVYILFHQDSIGRLERMISEKKITLDTLRYLANRAMSSSVLPHNLFNLNLHICTIGDVVFITDFEKETSTRIVDRNLVRFFKQLFDYVSKLENNANVGMILKELINPHSPKNSSAIPQN